MKFPESGPIGPMNSELLKKMRYSPAYLLKISQSPKTMGPMGPMGPEPPFKALMEVLEAGFALKWDPSGTEVLVVDSDCVAQGWSDLPKGIERLLELTFIVVRRDEAQVTEFWCPGDEERTELIKMGFPRDRVWTREDLGKRCRDNFESG